MQHVTALTLTFDSSVASELTLEQVNNMGPFLQGVLMESVDRGYAEALHSLSFNPYSQYCYRESAGEALVWRVNALTDEAAEHIVAPLQALDFVNVRRYGVKLAVLRKTTETLSIKSFTDIIREDVGENRRPKVHVRFMTPTAFKCQGQYVFMPTVRLILQNILMHYSQVYEGNNDVDAETLSYFDQHVRIASYNLRSCYFAHAAGEGKKVPSFTGSLTLSMSGPPTLVGLVRMLLRFAEYSGVGIKTSMGMGGVSCQWR